MSETAYSEQNADEEHMIRVGSSGLSLGIASLWRRRELVWIFVRRHISVRYRQMALGVVWALLEPLAYLLLMSAVFGLLLRVDTGEVPYVVFAFAGLMPWLLFNKATTAAAQSLVENMGLISKVYFPRLLLPVAGITREAFDSIIVFVLLVILAWFFGYPPGWKLLLAPLVLLYVAINALTVGLWLACAMVPFRDLRPLLALLLQAGMYATPVVYPPSLVPARALQYYQLNPMYWPIEIFRWLLLDQPLVLTGSFWVSLGLAVVALIGGLVIFSAGEKRVVDVQ
jgi:lipopolysaccharide transport system permease protein